ncbi:hypothetical protein D3C76_1413200 [compost metagenome]
MSSLAADFVLAHQEQDHLETFLLYYDHHLAWMQLGRWPLLGFLRLQLADLTAAEFG